jgi:uncharacterized protein YxjI
LTASREGGTFRGMTLLSQSTIIVKERVGLLKFSDTYDLLDPQSGQPIGIAQERPGGWVHALRFLINKQMLPTKVEIREQENGPVVLTIRRGFTLFRAKVSILDASGTEVAYLKSKVFSLGGGFHVYKPDDTKAAEVKGNWKGRSFRFLDLEGQEIGLIDQKWAGLGKELFTSADTYVVNVNPGHEGSMPLMLATALAVDVIMKESG